VGDYDNIRGVAANYARPREFPLCVDVEQYTFFSAMPDLGGQSVLDLGCGDGLYARLVKARGAGRVLGADRSHRMIDAARQVEDASPVGIEYVLGDATDLPVLGAFDLVTAAFVLHYARTAQALSAMCHGARRNLVRGGSFVAMFSNPLLDPAGPDISRYGLSYSFPQGKRDGAPVILELQHTPPLILETVYWSAETYEAALREGPFEQIQWHPMACSPESMQRHGMAYWADYFTNPEAIVVSAVAA